jgi:hypothetical protein
MIVLERMPTSGTRSVRLFLIDRLLRRRAAEDTRRSQEDCGVVIFSYFLDRTEQEPNLAAS